MSSPRTVVQRVQGHPTSDGAGVKLTRMIGTPLLPDLDPFLMLDAFGSEEGSDYIAGFPDHPHRGFETVTYMLAGSMRHQDSMGNSGHLRDGSVQWMTAGSGIIHSEMPEQSEGLMKGFQLWVNLPASHKMCSPRYQDIPPEEIPWVDMGGSRAKVLAGELRGTTGPVRDVITAPLLFDLSIPAGQSLDIAIPATHAAFAHCFEGAAEIAGAHLSEGMLGVLSSGDHVEIHGSAPTTRILLCAGKPIGEPIERWGPFVMNTPEQIREAISDYRRGRLVRPIQP
jgi:redox-sensitive bicupin YhaK (pirin superfamily)